MSDDTNPRARAIGALAEIFLEMVNSSDNLAVLESNAIHTGHECMTEALGLALEAYDSQLLESKPDGLKTHDIRQRTLATEIGDVSFSIRRYRDKFGCDTYLLADALDIPYGARISPGATSFLVEASLSVSYAKAAKLLSRNGSNVSATAVMGCLRQTGALCEESDKRAAQSLYEDGVLPTGQQACEELCVESDGTHFRTQKCPVGTPKHLEVKALVAYDGKEVISGKVRRKGCVHHALVGRPSEIWSQGAAAIGEKYDLTSIKEVHLGGDGEPWCGDAECYFPLSKVSFHLDPFHVNRAVMSCFYDAKAAWNVIDMLNEDNKLEAISLLCAYKDMGLVREKRASTVIGYLKNNIDSIAKAGPSLGTMESENQHLYGSRMDCWPCAWSIRGASDMARMISRHASNRAFPRMTREASQGERRGARRKEKELKFYENQGLPAAAVVKSIGAGYLPPHQADTRKMATGKAYALHKGMANLDRGI